MCGSKFDFYLPVEVTMLRNVKDYIDVYLGDLRGLLQKNKIINCEALSTYHTP